MILPRMVRLSKTRRGRRGVVVRLEDSIHQSAVGTAARMCVFTDDKCCGGMNVMVGVVTTGGGPQAV